MILSLPTLPQIEIWLQGKGGRHFPEHLAPGFDESCRYLVYEPYEEFICMIQTEEKHDTLKQRLAFMVEIDGRDIGYFPVYAPRGFWSSGRNGANHTMSVRQDFTERNHVFRFPASGALGQIIVRVFILKPLANILSFPADCNIYKWSRTRRDIRQYHILK
jgi:hypothetical protein